MTTYTFEEYLKMRRRDRREILKIAKENEDSVLIAQFKEFLLRRKALEDEDNEVIEEVAPVITKKKTDFEETIDLFNNFLFSDNEVKPVIVKRQKKVIEEVEPIIAENNEVIEEVAPVIAENNEVIEEVAPIIVNNTLFDIIENTKNNMEKFIKNNTNGYIKQTNDIDNFLKTLNLEGDDDDEIKPINIRLHSSSSSEEEDPNDNNEEAFAKFKEAYLKSHVINEEELAKEEEEIKERQIEDFTETKLWSLLQEPTSYDDKGYLKDKTYIREPKNFMPQYAPLSDRQLYEFLSTKDNKSYFDEDILEQVYDECKKRGSFWKTMAESVYDDMLITAVVKAKKSKKKEKHPMYEKLCVASEATKWVTFTCEVKPSAINSIKYRTLTKGGEPISTKIFPDLPKKWTTLEKTIPPKEGHNTLMTVTGIINDFFVLDLDVEHFDYCHTKKFTGALIDSEPTITRSFSGIELFVKLCIKNGYNEKTRVVSTPSGGKHLYFKYDPRVKTFAGVQVIYEKDVLLQDGTSSGAKETVYEQHGIDVRSDYAGIISPPSMSPIHKTEYTLTHDVPILAAPEWLINFLQHGKLNENLEVIEKVVKPWKDDFRYPDGTYDTYFIQKLLDVLPKEPFGRRDLWCNLGHALKGIGCSFDMFHEFSKIAPKYKNKEDCERYWNRFDIVNKVRKFSTIKRFLDEYVDDKVVDSIFKNTVKQPKYRPFTETPCWVNRSILEKYQPGKTEDHIKDLHSNFFMYRGDLNPTVFYYVRDNIRSKHLIFKSSPLGHLEKTLKDEKAVFRIDNISLQQRRILVNDLRDELEKLKANEKPTDAMIKKIKFTESDIDFKLKEIERDSNKSKPLLNKKLIKEVYLVTCDPSKDTIFINKHNKLPALNMYQRPPNNIDTIKTWIREHPNVEREQKAHTWLKNHLFHVVSCGNQKTYDWHINYFGNVLYNRGFRSDKWPLWVGSQGVGKSMVVDKLFKKYFGQAFGYLDNSSFASNGALTPLIGKTFAFLEEVKIEDRADLQKLKTLITSNVITYEAKFENPLNIPNFLTGILVSDQNIPIKCNEDQRRLLECRLDSRYIIGDPDELTGLSTKEVEERKRKYFDPLYEIEWQYFLSMFYDYDANYDFTTLTTEANEITSDRLMDPLDRFIKEKIIPRYGDYFPNYPSAKLFDEYKEFFTSERGIKCTTRQDLFNKQIVDKGVSVDAAKRVVVNKERKMCFEISKRDRIINLWSARNKLSLKDMLKDDCECQKYIAEVHCEKCKHNLCSNCKDNHDINHFKQFINLETNIPKKSNNYS